MNGRKTSSQDLRLVGLNRTIKKKSWFHEFHFDKEKRAKLVDIVAAFGGTMGLLTGFSLISGSGKIVVDTRGELDLFSLYRVVERKSYSPSSRFDLVSYLTYLLRLNLNFQEWKENTFTPRNLIINLR